MYYMAAGASSSPKNTLCAGPPLAATASNSDSRWSHKMGLALSIRCPLNPRASAVI